MSLDTRHGFASVQLGSFVVRPLGPGNRGTLPWTGVTESERRHTSPHRSLIQSIDRLGDNKYGPGGRPVVGLVVPQYPYCLVSGRRDPRTGTDSTDPSRSLAVRFRPVGTNRNIEAQNTSVIISFKDGPSGPFLVGFYDRSWPNQDEKVYGSLHINS